MSEYQPNSQIYALPREMLQLVVQYGPFYETYVDVLALIHDLLCEFTDSYEKPRFRPAEIYDRKNRAVGELYTAAISHDPQILVNNIEANFNLAREIRHSAESGETADERFQATRNAEQFLRSLLQTYTTLRILKQHREPAQQ